MIAAVTKVLLIEPTTNGVVVDAGMAGLTCASPLAADQIEPSGKMIDAEIPGMLSATRCCSSAWSSGAPSLVANSPLGVGVGAVGVGGGAVGLGVGAVGVGVDCGVALGAVLGVPVGAIVGNAVRVPTGVGERVIEIVGAGDVLAVGVGVLEHAATRTATVMNIERNQADKME